MYHPTLYNWGRYMCLPYGPTMTAKCDAGQHDYELVDENDDLLTGQKHRLVLYCSKCGDIIVSPLPDERDRDPAS